MHAEEIVATIVARLPGVVPKSSWGETALFYNPGRLLPNGVYFCTIKDHDGEHDRSSHLNREGIFRVALGLGAESYVGLFGPRPRRPPKGGAVNSGHDFTRVNELMPHPVYAWMGWVQILSPTQERFDEIFPLIEEAHRGAMTKFEFRTNRRTGKGR